MLSKNELAENPHSCTWFYNLDIHTNGMSQYRLHRSISGSRIYPGHGILSLDGSNCIILLMRQLYLQSFYRFQIRIQGFLFLNFWSNKKSEKMNKPFSKKNKEEGEGEEEGGEEEYW